MRRASSSSAGGSVEHGELGTQSCWRELGGDWERVDGLTLTYVERNGWAFLTPSAAEAGCLLGSARITYLDGSESTALVTAGCE